MLSEEERTSHRAGFDLLQVISKQEIRSLCRMSDVRGVWALVVTWGIVAASMALVYRFPNPATVVIAVAMIGARQLALAIFMHDASHHALLSQRGLNDWVGNWLAAYPVWADLHAYRPYHLQHHNHNWTDKDPDRGLASPFPVTAASFRRKVLRDLSGRTGLKLVRAAWLRDVDGEAALPVRFLRALRTKPSFRGMLVTNALLLAAVSLFAHPALYLLWMGAYLTTYTLVTRIRSIAEHSMTPDPDDPLRNARTTLASPIERLLIAPNHVNYHLEHHLLMTVPHYNLPRLHRLLQQRGLYESALVSRGYLSVLRQAASRSHELE